MRARAVRDLSVLVPEFEDDYLESVMDAPDEDLVDADVVGVDWSDLHLLGGRIDGSRLTQVNLSGSRWTRARLTGAALTGCDLSGARWDAVHLDRVHLRGCRMTGLRAADVTARDLLLEECRLDYATFEGLRATGAVAFVDCVLSRANLTRCRLPDAVLDDCALDDLELVECDLRGADLRGCRVEAVVGLDSLRGIRLDSTQLIDLATAAARNLDITLADN